MSDPGDVSMEETCSVHRPIVTVVLQEMVFSPEHVQSLLAKSLAGIEESHTSRHFIIAFNDLLSDKELVKNSL